MAYCAVVDFIARFGEEELIQLTDRVGAGAVDRTVFDRAAADADAEIDGYLAIRTALPLAAVPPLLVPLACDMVRFRLAADNPLEEVRKRYEDARRRLEGIAAGRIGLGLPAAAPAGDLADIAPGRLKVFGGGLA